ncbi:hypothetical protein [Methanobrevibacter sp.]|uniref:hypothetical protein n=1 Tax=Methanobrevibacter sp. TaxID=66852 RepID=UPI0038903F47
MKYIGRAKLNLSEKEVWRLTIREFLNLYQAYKDQFDTELMLRLNRMTFRQAEAESMRQQEWF